MELILLGYGVFLSLGFMVFFIGMKFYWNSIKKWLKNLCFMLFLLIFLHLVEKDKVLSSSKFTYLELFELTNRHIMRFKQECDKMSKFSAEKKNIFFNKCFSYLVFEAVISKAKPEEEFEKVLDVSLSEIEILNLRDVFKTNFPDLKIEEKFDMKPYLNRKSLPDFYKLVGLDLVLSFKSLFFYFLSVIMLEYRNFEISKLEFLKQKILMVVNLNDFAPIYFKYAVIEDLDVHFKSFYFLINTLDLIIELGEVSAQYLLLIDMEYKYLIDGFDMLRYVTNRFNFFNSILLTELNFEMDMCFEEECEIN